MVYIADTAWTEDLLRIAQNADLLLCQSSLYDEYLGMIPAHLTAGEAGQIAARAGVKHLVLTHLPHFGNHDLLPEQAGKIFAGKVKLATTRKVWILFAG
jgi:ribonuclease BN (tRNA processing enzyme)